MTQAPAPSAGWSFWGWDRMSGERGVVTVGKAYKGDRCQLKLWEGNEFLYSPRAANTQTTLLSYRSPFWPNSGPSPALTPHCLCSQPVTAVKQLPLEALFQTSVWQLLSQTFTTTYSPDMYFSVFSEFCWYIFIDQEWRKFTTKHLDGAFLLQQFTIKSVALRPTQRDKVTRGEGNGWGRKEIVHQTSRRGNGEKIREKGINGGAPDRCCLRGHYWPLCVFGTG